MDDLQEFSNPFGSLLTPQALAAMRQAQFQQQVAQASSPWIQGRDYAARMAGLGLGQQLSQLGGPPNTPLDRMAQQNQQILSDNTGAPQPTGDPYADRAALLEAKAAQFQAAGNPQVAMQLGAAAMQARQMGIQTQRLQGQADVEAGKAAEERAGAQYVVVDSSPDSNGIPAYKAYGDPISLYAGGKVDPSFQSNYQAAIAAAKQAGAQAPRLMTVNQLENSKANAAAIRAQATASAAAIKASTQGQSAFAGDPQALNMLSGTFALQGMPALARLPAADRAAVMSNLASRGLTYADTAEAKLQYAALQKAVNTGATRAGTVAFLSNEIPGQAANVLDALNSVDRTRIQAVNKLIASGKTEFGDPAEARYAVALNGLLVPYARLIAGATGVTSDAARDEANSLLSKYQAPDQVKAVISQIVDRELQTAKQAGDATIEMARNSTRYSALRKIAEKLGVPVTSLDAGDGGLGGGANAGAPLPGGGANTSATGSANTGGGATTGVPTATGPGGAKLYLINGQWTDRPSGRGDAAATLSGGGATGSF